MLNIDLRTNWELELLLPLVILHLIAERHFHLGLKSVALNVLLSVSSNTQKLESS